MGSKARAAARLASVTGAVSSVSRGAARSGLVARAPCHRAAPPENRPWRPVGGGDLRHGLRGVCRSDETRSPMDSPVRAAGAPCGCAPSSYRRPPSMSSPAWAPRSRALHPVARTCCPRRPSGPPRRSPRDPPTQNPPAAPWRAGPAACRAGCRYPGPACPESQHSRGRAQAFGTISAHSPRGSRDPQTAAVRRRPDFVPVRLGGRRRPRRRSPGRCGHGPPAPGSPRWAPPWSLRSHPRPDPVRPPWGSRRCRLPGLSERRRDRRRRGSRSRPGYEAFAWDLPWRDHPPPWNRAAPDTTRFLLAEAALARAGGRALARCPGGWSPGGGSPRRAGVGPPGTAASQDRSRLGYGCRS
jgi:hypothetical protein